MRTTALGFVAFVVTVALSALAAYAVAVSFEPESIRTPPTSPPITVEVP